MRVCESEEATSSLLAKVMDNNTAAAKLLAHAVHKPMHLTPLDSTQLKDIKFDLDTVGLWIDPIGKQANLSQSFF